MPVVKLYCLPHINEKKMNEMYEMITKTIAGIKELKITTDDITVLFVPDMMEKGLGDEIIVEVSKVLDKPDRTLTVIYKIAESLARAIWVFVCSWEYKLPHRVEVFVEVFGNPQKTALWTAQR